MAHHNITLQGTGSCQQEAYNNALDEFWHEEGHRYSVSRVLKRRRLDDVPPTRVVEETRGRMTYVSSQVWKDAPKELWRQVWEFEIDFHS